MKKHRVTTSKTTSSYNWLTGQRVATTKTYAHDQSTPPRASKTLSATGIKPWNPKRLGVALWAVVFLAILGSSTASGIAFLAVSALVAALVLGRRYWEHRIQEPEPVERPQAEPGAAWCDHCADWTVHETSEHAATR